MSDESVLHHDQLPLPDYDHLPIGSQESRIRSLDESGLQALLAYEQAHGNRLPAVQVLQHRLDGLAGGAEPTDGSPLAWTPEITAAPPTGSKVGPQTTGPAMNPPSPGDPTNPAQPR